MPRIPALQDINLHLDKKKKLTVMEFVRRSKTIIQNLYLYQQKPLRNGIIFLTNQKILKQIHAFIK
jgi:hypothetical protein